MTDPLGAVKIASDVNYAITKKLIDNYQKSVRTACIAPNIPDEDLRMAQWYGEQIQFLIKQTGYIINNHLINIKHNSWHTETDWAILKPESMVKIVDKALSKHPLTQQ